MRTFGHIEKFRVNHTLAGWGDERNGAFVIKLPGTRLTFQVIASTGAGWDHVSVSTAERCPRWDEMQQIKELFFEDSESVMQLHPAKSNYINQHPYCLHLWRPHHVRIPLPDKMMV
ncbi:DUF7694 domain-containing protein [Paenibacillus monticola]|uniref:DUF7694 domain-containing protein n=1 Tax=Paenibacillus monticola TaxID=2666075 RepID=A0A7X2L0D3_9BACL|nr:hypothetical protein [Paenibacillus monticola]MRN51970.1 hypothetical protein [Paenibacillus monticola]